MHPQPGPPGGRGQQPRNVSMLDRIYRAQRAWRMPARLRPEEVPDTRPQVLTVVVWLFVVDLTGHAAVVLNVLLLEGREAMTTVIAAIVVGAFRILLMLGVWTGREVPRWLVARLGVGLGVVEFFLALLSFSGARPGEMSIDPIDIVGMMAACAVVLNGFLVQLPSVRAWCAGRRF